MIDSYLQLTNDNVAENCKKVHFIIYNSTTLDLFLCASKHKSLERAPWFNLK